MTENDYAQLEALGARVTNGTAAELDALKARVAEIDTATTPLQTEYLARHEAMQAMTYAEFVEWFVDEHNRLLQLDFSVSMGAKADELDALKARVAMLEEALKPFALAASDKDVELADETAPLLVETWRYQKLSALTCGIITDNEQLRVFHLRAAADALAGKAP